MQHGHGFPCRTLHSMLDICCYVLIYVPLWVTRGASMVNRQKKVVSTERRLALFEDTMEG